MINVYKVIKIKKSTTINLNQYNINGQYNITLKIINNEQFKYAIIEYGNIRTYRKIINENGYYIINLKINLNQQNNIIKLYLGDDE